MSSRRITELQEIAGINLVEQDLFTVVSVNEVDPALKNKKLTISGTKAYLNIYYLPRTGGTISGNVIIESGLTISGSLTVSGLTSTGTSTLNSLIVQNGLTVSGNISSPLITGTTVSGTTVQGTTVSGTTVTGNTVNAISGNFSTRLSGTVITGNTISGTSGVFQNLSGNTITGNFIQGASGFFDTLIAPNLGVSGDFTVLSGLFVSGNAQFRSNASITGTLSGTTITGNTLQATNITGVTSVFTTSVSGALITGDTGQFSNITGVSGTFTTRVSGAVITGNAGNFGTVTGVSGVFTQIVSGATITGGTGQFTNLTGVTLIGTTTVSGATVTGNAGQFTNVTGTTVVGTTSVSGATVTGNVGQFTSVTGTSVIGTTNISGAIVTGDTGRFTDVTGTTVVGTTSVSGTTVTGNAGQFTNLTGIVVVGTTTVSGATITGNVGQFTNVTGTTVIGTTTVSGATVTGNAGQFTSVTGVTVVGTTTVSGTTVTGTNANFTNGTFAFLTGGTITGTAGQFTTVTGISGAFTVITGATVTGTNANFANGIYTTRLSGTTITGATGLFTTITATTGTFTNIDFTSANIGGNLTVSGSGFFVSGVSVSGTVSGVTFTGTTGQFTTVTGISGAFTVITGTTVTGTTANFVNGVYTTQLSGTTVTGTNANFTNGTFVSLTGTTTVVTSGVFGAGSAAAPSIAFNGDLNTGIYSPGADQLALATSGTGRLFITSAGLLGVGTSSPDGPLTINTLAGGAPTYRGDVILNQSGGSSGVDANGGIELKINGTGGGYGARILQAFDGATSYNFVIQTRNNSATWSTRLLINSSGAVGIGTSSPATALDVVGQINATTGYASTLFGINTTPLSTTSTTQSFLRFKNTTGDFYVGIESSTGGAFFPGSTAYAACVFNAASTPLQFFTAGTLKATIDTTGRLGIGTNTPAELLHVSGTSDPSIQLTATNDATPFINWSTNGSNRLQISSSSSVGGHINVRSNQEFKLSTNNTERLQVTSGGNVGIGVTPVTKLDLSGNYAQNITAVSALNIDLSTSNYFTKTINGNSTFTVSNTPASRAYAFTLELTHTSGTITWFSNLEWPDGSAPTLTTGKTHLFMFVTDDGGARWRGSSLINYAN